MTSSSTEPSWFSSTTLCLPGASPLTVRGVTPLACPSTDTFAPDGSVRTSSCPTSGVAFGISMNWETSAFAAMVTDTVLWTPDADSSSVCFPAFKLTLSGVTPRCSPSMTMAAPAGSV